MTAPACPNCDELLVAFDLLASGRMIYTCPRCKSNFDSSLKELLVKGNKCIACEIGRIVKLGADEMICDTCHARYNVREVIVDKDPDETERQKL